MPKIPKIPPLHRKVRFGDYVGLTFGQLVERDPDYVKYILYKTNMALERDLVEALEEALEILEEEDG